MPKNTNLATKMTKKQQEKLAAVAWDQYEEDIRSRTKWNANIKTWLELLDGRPRPKSFPWPHASNVHVPLVGVAALQFNARALEAIIPGKNVVKVLADSRYKLSGRRVSSHMNWQLLYDMENFEYDTDAMLMQLPTYGTADKKTFYDPLKGKVVSNLLPIDALVVPYGVRRLCDAPRKTHAFWELVNDMKEKESKGIYINTKSFKEEETEVREDDPSPELEQVRREKEGQEESRSVTGNSRLVLEQHNLWFEDFKSGRLVPIIATIDHKSKKLLRVDERQIKNIVTGTIEAIEFFTRYQFLVNPESSYGIGFGQLLEHLNLASNSIINQLIDSGYLQNLQGGFVNKRSSFKRGELSWQMGKFTEVDVGTDDLRKAIIPFDFGPPSTVLFQLLAHLQNLAERISTVSESMLGQTPRSDTTATANVLAVEQGVKVFSAVHKRIHREFKQELKKIFFWNGRHPNDKVYSATLDFNSDEFSEMISNDEKFNMKEDYSRVIDIIPVSDPTIISSQERLARAQGAYQLGVQDPVISQDQGAMFELKNDLFEAFGTRDVRRIVKRPETLDIQDFTPEEENARFLKEMQSSVLPRQDHQAHIASHRSFEQGKFTEELTPRGSQLLAQHVQSHFANMSLQPGQQGQPTGIGQQRPPAQPPQTGIQ